MTDTTDHVARMGMTPEERAQTSNTLEFECAECEGINDQPQHWDMARGQMWPEWNSCVACMAPVLAAKDARAARDAARASG